MDWKKLKHVLYRFLAKPSGLEKTPVDTRDFQVGIFGWGEYKPLHQTWRIKTVSVKDQTPFNTCQWNATIAAKEVDEGTPLSVRSIVAWGVKNGYVSGDGFSNLRSGQLALKEFGAVEEAQLAEDIDDWARYKGVDLGRFGTNAAKHKIQSFWAVSNRNDILKLLDEGHALTTGIDWYTGFNQGGGFKHPWLITRPMGYKVGGHAITIVGYRLSYYNEKVYVCQNSYSKNWGDNGDFYIKMDYLENDNYGIYVNLDLEIDLAKFLNKYDGQNVKGSGPTIYFIQKGLKKAYPDEVTYLAYNVTDTDIKKWTQVEDEILSKVKTGDDMDITKSIYWDFLKDVSNEQRLNKLIELMTRK